MISFHSCSVGCRCIRFRHRMHRKAILEDVFQCMVVMRKDSIDVYMFMLMLDKCLWVAWGIDKTKQTCMLTT